MRLIATRWSPALKYGLPAVVAVAVALWLARGVSRAREAARHAQCAGHLKWIALVLHNYHDAHGSFPIGTAPNPSLPPERRLSWLVSIWDIQSNGTVLALDPTKAWNEPPNWPPRVTAQPNVTFVNMAPDDSGDWVTCPDNPGYRVRKPFVLSYVGVAGVGADAPVLPVTHQRAGVFGYDRATRIEDITDGTARTMMVIESAVGAAPWTAGGWSSVRGVDPATRPYIGRGRPFGGYHPGGANVAFADGSVHFVRATTDPKVFEAAATIAGGEPVHETPGYPRRQTR